MAFLSLPTLSADYGLSLDNANASFHDRYLGMLVAIPVYHRHSPLQDVDAPGHFDDRPTDTHASMSWRLTLGTACAARSLAE